MPELNSPLFAATLRLLLASRPAGPHQCSGAMAGNGWGIRLLTEDGVPYVVVVSAVPEKWADGYAGTEPRPLNTPTIALWDHLEVTVGGKRSPEAPHA